MRYCLYIVGLLGACVTSSALAEVTVTQSHKAFDTDHLVIKSGEVIHFENSDDVKHNIQVIDATDVISNLGLQKPGESVDARFDHPGEFRIRCQIHPNMKLTVDVQ